MTRPNVIARNYLTPPSDSFWAWTDDGDAVIWVDGQPIASRPEIEAVLARLAPRGLPPFGAVVLMLAACQPGWKENPGGKDTLKEYLKALVARRERPTGTGTAAPMVNVIAQRLHGVIRGLDAVGALPPDLREKLDNKSVIAEILFEESKNRTTAEAAGIVVSELKRGIPGRALVHDVGPLAVYDAFLTDIEALKPGLEHLSEEYVRQRLLTGMDHLVKAALLELPPSERVRRMLAELVTDRELAGLARLAQRLVAAVHVPRRLAQPEELPLGGVSDLANRGPLERLLISELAHDDLTLAVRIALNEALYLRREAPPRSPPERRCVLIDAGLRMWGVPRIFGAASALALAATADRNASLEAHRARRGAVVPVDLTTREGLLLHLEALEPGAHPGSALAPWLEALEKSDPGGEAHSDLVVVTHEDALADPAFTACLSAMKDSELYAATVNREGQFRLQLITRSGRRPICSARLALEEVLETTTSPVPFRPVVAPEDERLPLILAMRPFPLLLPANIRPEHVGVGPGKSAVALTKDGRLLQWRGEGRGGQELSAQVPAGKVGEVHVLDNGTAEVLVRREAGGSAVLVRADLGTGAVGVVELAGSLQPPLAVRRQADALLWFSRGRVDAFDPGTGERFATMGLGGMRFVAPGFLTSNNGWYSVAFGGQEISVRRVSGVLSGTIALFDREGLDGPWGITDKGSVYSTATGQLAALHMPVEAPVFVDRVSRDGHRLIVRSRKVASMDRYLVDLQKVETRRVYGGGLIYGLEPAVHQALRALGGSVRRNLKGLALGADGSLLLVPGDGRALTVSLDRGGIQLTYTGTVFATRPRPMQPQVVPFQRIPAPRDTHFSLAEAVFADGSRAFLDGRGMLHLKSADRTLAEVTLVLNDTAVAAWTTGGHVCGPRYFTGDLPASDPRPVWEDLQRIVRRLR